MTTKAKVTNAETGNGYAATIERDGKVVYNSEKAFPKHGVFPEVTPAELHGDAWATRLLELPARIAAHKAEVAVRTCEEGVILTAQIREGAREFDRAKKKAKGHKDAIDQRRERLEDIQAAPAAATMKLAWTNREDPKAVEIIAEHTELDEPFAVEVEDDPRQMSLPGANWTFTHEDGGVTRVAGYGQIKMRREGDSWVITLGAEEHELVAELGGPVVHTRGQDTEADEEAEAEVVEPVVFVSGKLKDKPLRERLEQLSRPETIIGLYKLETSRKKPRKRMVKALEHEMSEHPTHEAELIMAWTEVDEDRPTQLPVDVAAAALASATDEELAEATDRWLEEAVAGCGDPMVLNWLIDGERDRDDEARDHVISVATERLRALGQEAEPGAEQGQLHGLELVSEAAQ